MKKKSSRQPTNKSLVLDLIMAKYRSDPDGFRRYLPEVADAIDTTYQTRKSRLGPFGLTEHEKSHRIDALEGILKELKGGQITRDEAIRALEHCAVLTEDDNLPAQVDRRVIMRLLGIVLGQPLTDITAETTVEAIKSDTSAPVVNRISILRGVVLNLSHDMRLISLSVTPQKIREAQKAMRLIAIAGLATQELRLKTTTAEEKNATS